MRGHPLRNAFHRDQCRRAANSDRQRVAIVSTWHSAPSGEFRVTKGLVEKKPRHRKHQNNGAEIKERSDQKTDSQRAYRELQRDRRLILAQRLRKAITKSRDQPVCREPEESPHRESSPWHRLHQLRPNLAKK